MWRCLVPPGQGLLGTTAFSRPFTEARAALEAYLAKENPDVWPMLSDGRVGFTYTEDALVFFFGTETRDFFERLSKPPYDAILKDAAGSAECKLKLLSDQQEILIDPILF